MVLKRSCSRANSKAIDLVAEEMAAFVALYQVCRAPGRIAFSLEMTTVDPGPFFRIAGTRTLEARYTLRTLTLKRRSNSSAVTSRPDLFGYDQPALWTTTEGAFPNRVTQVSSYSVIT